VTAETLSDVEADPDDLATLIAICDRHPMVPRVLGRVDVTDT